MGISAELRPELCRYHGEVITSLVGRLWSIILFLTVSFLMVLAVTGILFMIGGLIFGYIETEGISFGIYG